MRLSIFLRNAFVFIGLISILTLEGGYFLFTLALALMGLFGWRSWPSTIQYCLDTPGALWILGAMAWYVSIGLFFGVYQDYRLSYYEALVPFLLAPLVLHGVLKAHIHPNTLWIGASVSTFFASLQATYQHFVLNIDRAYGGLKNPIIFGDLSIVYAAVSLMGYLHLSRINQPTQWRWLCLLGFVAGLVASLFSGSKGGWLSIFLIWLFFVWQFAHNRSIGFKWGIFGVGALAIALLFLAMPSHIVVDRIISGFQAGLHWFQTGQVTDGSVSVRLELWRRGILMWNEYPFLGWSGPGLHENLSAQMASMGLGWFGGNLESDLLQTLVSLGLVGLLGKLGLYGMVLLGFIQMRRHLQAQHAPFALMGALLVMLMIEFGLSVIVMGHNSFRHTFVILTILLLAMGKNGRTQPDQVSRQGLSPCN